MISAGTTGRPRPPHEKPTTDAPPEHYRTRCTKCNGTGQALEYRLTWKTHQGALLPPQKHARRVESEEEGERLRRELEPGAFEAKVESGARKCSCRTKKEPLASRVANVMPIRERGESRFPSGIDRKTVATGERE